MIPVRPPRTNIDRKQQANSIGEANEMRPPYIVASQLKYLIPVGIDTSRLAAAKYISNVRLMPAANMWCAHTPMLMNTIAIVAAAMNSYPNSTLRENTGMTSDTIPKAGRIRMYTSGCPKNQNKCCHKYAEPPACGLKNRAPNRRSNSSIASAAVSGGMASRICTLVQNMVQVKNGTLIKVIPGQRMVRIVATKFTPAAMVPTPLTKSPSAQNSTPAPRLNAVEVNGA